MMTETQLQTVNAVAATVTALIGFAAPWPEVVMGMFFAAAGGFAGMVVSPPADRLTPLITLFVALFIGILAGIAHPHAALGGLLTAWIADLPVQLVMGAAGIASPWFARRAASGNMALPWSRSNGGQGHE
ncbi:MAG: hypothetical protein AAFR88_10420 [Pseudomonadota bacterium]